MTVLAGTLARRCLGLTAGAAACFYVGWNVFWIAKGRLPPSIFKWTTGIPVPTTGITRSGLSAMRGDWAASLAWNAFLVPIACLFAATAFALVRRLRARERLVMPTWLARSWFAVLLAAWVVKLVQGPVWW